MIAAIVKGRRVLYDGKKSACVVLDHSQEKSGHRRFYFLDLRYQVESGEWYTSKVECSFEDLQKYPSGTKIECKVLGENMYVNRYNLRVVEE